VSGKAFDPIIIEAQLVQAKVLPTRSDTPPAYPGTLEQNFTEHDPRKWALWRISMVRQFQPEILSKMSAANLLYLAGQSPEGYVGEEVYGIQLDRNKVAQNAARARVELETRATRGAWRRSLVTRRRNAEAGSGRRKIGEVNGATARREPLGDA
jgi:hypothetical protein